AADGNTISGNGGDGISISENIRQVKIFGNRIGTNEAASAALANNVAGIRVQSSQNQIGLAGKSRENSARRSRPNRCRPRRSA
ncbi:MAG TPA: hypothetical protein VF721_02645, partial [Pyrinomonadaceae bacterium]